MTQLDSGGLVLLEEAGKQQLDSVSLLLLEEASKRETNAGGVLLLVEVRSNPMIEDGGFALLAEVNVQEINLGGVLLLVEALRVPQEDITFTFPDGTIIDGPLVVWMDEAAPGREIYPYGGTVRLLDPDGNEVASFTYEEPNANESWTANGSAPPTPGW